MNFKHVLSASVIAAVVTAGSAFGDAHADKAALAAVKARQAQMTLYSFNLGLLGGMAKGEIDYDAASAQGAAANLAALSKMDQSRFWVPGSDSDTLGDASRALQAIWSADSTARAKGMSLAEAAGALEMVAGNGLDALRGAMGPVGQSCGACHDAYRKPK